MGHHGPPGRLPPTFQEEAALYARGYRRVAGIDEVGRGPLAGPVMAAAVALPAGALPSWTQEIRDSKLLPPERRRRLSSLIGEIAPVGLGMVDPGAIDRVGIWEATRQAMARAAASLSPTPDFLLVDGRSPGALPVSYKSLIKGDVLCLSIAAASIVAKVARDTIMLEMDQTYPGYHFSQHKGYATAEHRRLLLEMGPCPIHRRSFLRGFPAFTNGGSRDG